MGATDLLPEAHSTRRGSGWRSTGRRVRARSSSSRRWREARVVAELAAGELAKPVARSVVGAEALVDASPRESSSATARISAAISRGARGCAAGSRPTSPSRRRPRPLPPSAACRARCRRGCSRTCGTRGASPAWSTSSCSPGSSASISLTIAAIGSSTSGSQRSSCVVTADHDIRACPPDQLRSDRRGGAASRRAAGASPPAGTSQ